MKSVIIFLSLLVTFSTAQHVDLKQVRCLVCRTIVDEFVHVVSKIDPKRKMSVGQYKLDADGNGAYREIPLSQSEIHLSETLETVCEKMEDYVRATYKSNGQLILMKLITEGGLNPLMHQVDIVQDGDLNKSLKHFCEEVVNDNEDAFIDTVRTNVSNPKNKICTKVAKYCGELEENLDDSADEPKDDDDLKSDKTEL